MTYNDELGNEKIPYYDECDEIHDTGFIEKVFDSMHDWVRVLDLKGNVVFMNMALMEYFEWHPESVALFSRFSRTREYKHLKSWNNTVAGILQEEKSDAEFEVDGKTFAVISSPLNKKSGEVGYTVEVFRDVTRLKRLQDVIVKQNMKFEDDLGMAKMLQRRLLPHGSPNPAIEFNYIYEPCELLGGDFIDMYNIGDTHLGVYIADVSGHGVAASILTVFLRTAISKRIKSPAETLRLLFQEFKANKLDPELYITVFYAIYDLKNGILKYSNAGHGAVPVLYNKNRKDKQTLLMLEGVPISTWVDSTEYKESSVKIESGDRLFLYTDGLTDVSNTGMERYGSTRVNNSLKNCPDDHNEALKKILNDAKDFAGIRDSSEQSDDITLSIIELK